MSTFSMDTLNKVLAATRAKDWRLSFVPFVMGGVYLWIWWFELPISGRLLWLTFLSLTTTVGFASLGYFINEYFDKAYDARAGKLNKLAFISPAYQFGIFFGTILFTFLPWLCLPFDSVSVAFFFTELLLFLVYSLPFPRWKEHTYFSIVVDSAYAYVVPLLLSFHTFSLIAEQKEWPIWLWCFVATAFFIGIRNILVHQAEDAVKDQRNNTQTLPLLIGKSVYERLIVIVAGYELMMVGLWIISLSIERSIFALWAIALLLACFFARQGFATMASFQKTGNFTLNKIYQYVFPAFVLFLLLTRQPLWAGLLLLIHLFFFVQYDLVGKTILLLKILYQAAIKFYWETYILIRHIISVIINYTIFYLFLLFGVDLKKEGKSAKEYLSKRKQ